MINLQYNQHNIIRRKLTRNYFRPLGYEGLTGLERPLKVENLNQDFSLIN